MKIFNYKGIEIANNKSLRNLGIAKRYYKAQKG